MNKKFLPMTKLIEKILKKQWQDNSADGTSRYTEAIGESS